MILTTNTWVVVRVLERQEGSITRWIEVDEFDSPGAANERVRGLIASIPNGDFTSCQRSLVETEV